VKRITTNNAHGVVVTAFSPEAYETAPTLLRPQGTMIVRSVVGTMKDVDEALVFIARDLMHVSDTKQMLEVALNAANVETIARSNQRNAG